MGLALIGAKPLPFHIRLPPKERERVPFFLSSKELLSVWPVC